LESASPFAGRSMTVIFCVSPSICVDVVLGPLSGQAPTRLSLGAGEVAPSGQGGRRPRRTDQMSPGTTSSERSE
jgi:hypothetical protein